MASTTLSTVVLICPKCGHEQREPRSAYSTVCRKCHTHVRVQEVLKPAEPPARKSIAQRHIRCFDCGAELEVPVSAESTMCKCCSAYVDLQDYRINHTVSKNFRTYGRLVIEEKGYVLNTDSRVGEAVVKGRLIGKLTATGSLEIHSRASIKGSFSAAKLIIPATEHFWWPDTIRVGTAEIAGELAAHLRATGKVVLKSTARFFGDIDAASLVVEPGAVFVGNARIGCSDPLPAPSPAPPAPPGPPPPPPSSAPRVRPKPRRSGPGRR